MRKQLVYLIGYLFLTSCAGFHEIETIPADQYRLSAEHYRSLGDMLLIGNPKKVEVQLEVEEDRLKLFPASNQLPAADIPLSTVKDIKLRRHTFDIDVFTIPFKVRPSQEDFPTQLNANFSAALYLGRREDFYRIKALPRRKQKPVQLTGVGYGYGGFIGLGATTMNPFVTQNQISYEYDGLVLTSGLAGIYDAKKFNVGLALGADILLDKNKKHWLYQGKPWIGLLFGFNLN